METAFIVFARDGQPHMVVTTSATRSSFKPLKNTAKNIATMFNEEYSKSQITKPELSAALDRGMTVEGPMPPSSVAGKIKKVRLEAAKQKKHLPVIPVSDVPLGDFTYDEFFDAVSFKASSFVTERYKSTFNYEVKRVRALWDRSLSIPGTGRRGGWRCPPDTVGGGQITDRFGRNCGWGIARRLANAIAGIGEQAGTIGGEQGGGTRRAQRRMRQLGGGPERGRQGGPVERGLRRVAERLQGDRTQTPSAAPVVRDPDSGQPVDEWAQYYEQPVTVPTPPSADERLDSVSEQAGLLERGLRRIADRLNRGAEGRERRPRGSRAEARSTPEAPPTPSAETVERTPRIPVLEPEAVATVQEPEQRRQRFDFDLGEMVEVEVPTEEPVPVVAPPSPEAPIGFANLPLMSQGWDTNDEILRGVLREILAHDPKTLAAVMKMFDGMTDSQRREMVAGVASAVTGTRANQVMDERGEMIIVGNDLKASLARYIEFETGIRLTADENFVIPDETFDDARKVLDQEMDAATTRLEGLARRFSTELAGLDLRGGDMMRLHQLLVGIANTREKMRRLEAMRAEDLLTPELRRVVNSGISADLAREITERIEKYPELQEHRFAKHLVAKFGEDGELPWDGITPERWADMTARERSDYLKGAYTVEGIVGSQDGKIYSTRVSDISTMQEWIDNGDIYDEDEFIRQLGLDPARVNPADLYIISGQVFDESGRLIGEFQRAVSVSSGEVAHELFKLYESDNQGQGISEIFNQFAFRHLQQIGVDTAVIKATAWDGPYVWGRVGYQTSNGDIGTPARDELRADLLRYANGEESIIESDEQFALFQFLLADPSQKLSHQAVIYALESGDFVDEDAKRERRRKIKNFVSRNVPFSKGYLKFGEQNLKPDPRPLIRQDVVPPNPDPIVDMPSARRDASRVFDDFPSSPIVRELEERPLAPLPDSLLGIGPDNRSLFPNINSDEVRDNVFERLRQAGTIPTAEQLKNLTDTELMQLAELHQLRADSSLQYAESRLDSLRERMEASGGLPVAEGIQLGAADQIVEASLMRIAQQDINEEIKRRRRAMTGESPVKPSEGHGSDLFDSLRNGDNRYGPEVAESLELIWDQLPFDVREDLISHGFRKPEADRQGGSQSNPQIAHAEAEIRDRLQLFFDGISPDDFGVDYQDTRGYDQASELVREAALDARDAAQRIQRALDEGREIPSEQIVILADSLRSLNERNARLRQYKTIWDEIVDASRPEAIRERLGDDAFDRAQELRKNIESAIAEYGDKQRRIGAKYLIDRYGRDGELPWEGMTPERWASMSSLDKQVYLQRAYTHYRIVGKNGDVYKTEVRVADTGYGGFLVEGSIYDSAGRRVGEFKRTVNSSQGTVEHNLFKLFYEGDKGQDLATIVAQHSYEFLSRIGVTEAEIGSTGWDGPFVWGRVGFYGGDIGTGPRRRLSEQIREFRNGGYSSLIDNEDQANLLEIMLASGDEITHQELIYVLGYDGATDRRKGQIKQWIIDYARFDSGVFDITRDTNSDSRDLISGDYLPPATGVTTPDIATQSVEDVADSAVDDRFQIIRPDSEAAENINTLVANLKRSGAEATDGRTAHGIIQFAVTDSETFGESPRGQSAWQDLSDTDLVEEHRMIAERLADTEEIVLRELRDESLWIDGQISPSATEELGSDIAKIKMHRAELESSREEIERRRKLRKSELRNEIIANARANNILDTRDPATGERILSQEAEDRFTALPNGNGTTIQQMIEGAAKEEFLQNSWDKYVGDDLDFYASKSLEEINDEIAAIDEEIATYLGRMGGHIERIEQLSATPSSPARNDDLQRAVRTFRDGLASLVRAQYHRATLETARRRKESNIPDGTDVLPESRLANEFMADHLEHAEYGMRVLNAAMADESINAVVTVNSAALVTLGMLDDDAYEATRPGVYENWENSNFLTIVSAYREAVTRQIDSLSDDELEDFAAQKRSIVDVSRARARENFEQYQQTGDSDYLREALWADTQARLRSQAVELALLELDRRRNGKAEQDRKNGREAAAADTRSSATQADRRSASEQQAARIATRRPTEQDEPIEGTQIQQPAQRVTTDPEAKSSEELKPIIQQMVDDYTEYQTAQLGLYLQDTYGDGDLPWTGMTPARFAAMSEYQQMEYLSKLYSHQIIQGRDGRRYKVVTDVRTMSDDYEYEDELYGLRDEVDTYLSEVSEAESRLEAEQEGDIPEAGSDEERQRDERIAELEDELEAARENLRRAEDRLAEREQEGPSVLGFQVNGYIYEIDADGRRMGDSIGEFDRQIDTMSGNVEHASFFIRPEHHGQGLATIVNGHAFPGLEAMGIDEAFVSTGSDGPYVWGRMGFEDADLYDRDRYARRAEQELRNEIARFRMGDPSIVSSERQARLLEAMMENGQTTRQAVAFILEGESGPDEARANQITRWMLSNYPLSRGRMGLREHSGDARRVVENLSPEQLRRAQRARGMAPTDVPDVVEDNPDTTEPKSPEELRQIVRNLIEDYRDYQTAMLGTYLTDRYGDGDFPWAGLTRAQFDAMSPDEKREVFRQFWTHPLIIGRNGKRYQIEADVSFENSDAVERMGDIERGIEELESRIDDIDERIEEIGDEIDRLQEEQDDDEEGDIDNSEAIQRLQDERIERRDEKNDIRDEINELQGELSDLEDSVESGEYTIYGTISEINEDGDIVAWSVANFERTVSATGDSVEHDSFYVDAAHQGAGLSSVVNGHAFLGLHQIGITQAAVSTGSDGPYVWGRVGFDDNDYYRQRQAETALRDQIERFREGRESIVMSEKQAKLLEAMMDGGMTTRQAVIFILETEDREDRADEIKQWMLQNYRLARGYQTLTGGDPRESMVVTDRVRRNAPRGMEPNQVEVDVPEVREPETPPTVGGLGGDIPYTPLVSVGSQVPKLPDELTASIQEALTNLPDLSRWLLSNAQEALGAVSVAGREGVARLEARLATEMATAAADIAGGMSPEDAISNLQQRLGLTNYGISESQVVEEVAATIRGQLSRIQRGRQMLEDVAQNGDRPTPPEMMEPRPPGPPGPPIPMSEYARRLIVDSMQRLSYSPDGSGNGGLLGEYMYWSAIAESGLRGQLDALKTSLRSEPVFDADALDAASNLGQDAAQIVTDRITEGRARRVKSVLGYLDESDLELPWERSFDEVDTDDPVAVRRAFLAMTDAQKRDYLTGLYYHFEIVGSNGRRYQVRPRVFMDDVYSEEIDDMVPGAGVVLEIWEVDEEGNDISKVGGGERTIYFGMGGETPRVTHQSLSVDHRNAGITTILNGFAFMGLEKIGIRHVDVATADDGPYVWARMGFSAGPVSQRQRQRFQAALRSFEQFGPNGLIQNANQYALVKALLADPDSEHIHFIFALSDPDDSPQRREFLKTWFIANAPIDWGTLDISREQSPEVMARAEELSRRNRSKSLRPKGRFFTYLLEAKAIVAMSQGIPGSRPYGPRISVKSGNSPRPKNAGLVYGDIRSVMLTKGLGKPIGGISEIDGDGDGFVTGPDGEDNIPAAAAAAAQAAGRVLAGARRGRPGDRKRTEQTDEKPSGPQTFDVDPTQIGSAVDGKDTSTVNDETDMYDILPSGEQFIREATSSEVMGDAAEYAGPDASRAEDRAKRVLDAQVEHLYGEMDRVESTFDRWLDDRGEPPTDEEIDDFIEGEFLRIANDFRNGRTPADDQDPFSGPATGRNNSEPDSIDDSIENVERKINALAEKMQAAIDDPNAPRPGVEDASTLVDLLRQRHALRTLKGFYEQGKEFLRDRASASKKDGPKARDPKEFRDKLPSRSELVELGVALRDAINADIEARAEKREATVGEYMLERHGDEPLFWQAISEEQFLAMSPMQRLETLSELFSHPIIKGRNGKYYAVVPQPLESLAYAQDSSTSVVKADIFEVDAEGNVINPDPVGYIERTFDLDESVVSHDKFFIFGAEHKGAGIATTVNGYAMPAFKQFGFDSVELIPASDGPYVWPLVGFRGKDYLTDEPVDLADDELEKLRMALEGYERLGATPGFRGLIRNDDEYLVIRALLEESRVVPLTHQELLFALGVKQGDEDRDEEVKRWMITNSSMVRAVMDLKSADDPRDAVRRLASAEGREVVVEPKPIGTPTGRPTGAGVAGRMSQSDDLGRFTGDDGRTVALSAAADIALTEDARFMEPDVPGMIRLPEQASWREANNARGRRLDSIVGKYYDDNGMLTDEGRQLNNALRQYLATPESRTQRRRRLAEAEAPEAPTQSGPSMQMSPYNDIVDNHSRELPRLTEGSSFVSVPVGNMGINTKQDAERYRGPLSDVPDQFLLDAVKARSASYETMRDIAREMNIPNAQNFVEGVAGKFLFALHSPSDDTVTLSDEEKEFVARVKETGATLITVALGESGGVTGPIGYFLLTDNPAEMGRGYILKHPDIDNVDYMAGGIPMSNYSEIIGNTLAAGIGFANTPPRLIPWGNGESPRLLMEIGLNNSAKRVTGFTYQAEATTDPEGRLANAMINAVMGVEDRHSGNAMGFVDDGVMPIDFGAAEFPRGDQGYFRWYAQNKFWMDQNPWGGFFAEAIEASEDELDAAMERGKQQMAEALARISDRMEAALKGLDQLDSAYPGIPDDMKQRWRSNLLYSIQQLRDPRVVDDMMSAVKTFVRMRRVGRRA